MKLKVFEAFAGIGSQSMALRNLGIDYEVVGISEVDRWALLGYDAIHNEMYDIELPSKEEMLKEFYDKHIAYNFSTNKSEIPKRIEDIEKLYKAHIKNKNYGDIRLINVEDLPQMDLFTYSYPCKNISVAGQQAGLEEGSNTQSSLVWECFKIIEYCKPKYLLMENVRNLVGKKHKPQFDLICEKLENLGYNNYWNILNGKDFGVPQNRERVMMVSIRKDIDNGKFIMPKGFPLGKNMKDILETNVEEMYYIANEKFKFNDNFLDKKQLYNSDKKKLIQLGLLNTRGNESNRRVYWEEGICPTINSMNGGNRQPKILIDLDYNYKIRKLTPKECWRLMGFLDEDFYKAKEIGGLSNSKLYERAGRGIVVPMLEEIFKNLFLVTSE